MLIINFVAYEEMAEPGTSAGDDVANGEMAEPGTSAGDDVANSPLDKLLTTFINTYLPSKSSIRNMLLSVDEKVRTVNISEPAPSTTSTECPSDELLKELELAKYENGHI